MKKLTLLPLYEAILKTGGLHVDKNGLVSNTYGDTTTAVEIEGKRLVLPTQEHLRSGDWANKIIFHPGYENIMRGTSAVMDKLRAAINAKANMIISQLMYELMTIVTSVGMHSKMSPDQQELLSKVVKADEKTLKTIVDIIAAMRTANSERKFVNIYVKNGGKAGGKQWSRASIVRFPFYDELLAADKAVYGVTLRKTDKAALIEIMEFMFPAIKDDGGYSRGSNCDIAPTLDCMMKAVMGIADRINSVCKEYSKLLTNGDDYVYDDDWCDSFENLGYLSTEIKMIPMQAGNEGATNNEPVKAPGLVTPQPTPVQYAQQPVYQPMQYQQPYQPLQPAGPVMTQDGKVDFRASMMANPQLAATMQPVQVMQSQYPPQQPQRVPSWQQPQQMYGSMQQFQQPMQQQYGYQPQTGY